MVHVCIGAHTFLHLCMIKLVGIDGISKLPACLAKLKQEYDVKIKLARAMANLDGSPNKPDSRPTGGSVCTGGN